MYLNNRPVTDFGFKLSEVTDWVAPPPFEVTPLTLYGRAGASLIGQTGRTATRTFSTKLVSMTGVTLAGRRTNLSALYRASQGAVAVRFDDDPTKEIYTLMSSGSTAALAVAMVDGAVSVDLQWLTYDPYWHDVAVSSCQVYGGGNRYAVTCGSAPHGGVMHITGAGTSPITLTLRNAAGTALGTMTLTTTFTSGEYVEIDFDRKRIEKVNDTTRTNLLTTLGATEDFFVFSPEDQPTLSLTNATSAVLYYRKAWVA